jgi:hypothetical protein
VSTSLIWRVKRHTPASELSAKHLTEKVGDALKETHLLAGLCTSFLFALGDEAVEDLLWDADHFTAKQALNFVSR